MWEHIAWRLQHVIGFVQQELTPPPQMFLWVAHESIYIYVTGEDSSILCGLINDGRWPVADAFAPG